MRAGHASRLHTHRRSDKPLTSHAQVLGARPEMRVLVLADMSELRQMHTDCCSSKKVSVGRQHG